MKAYSQDLRSESCERSMRTEPGEIAKTFAVSVATIKRYLKQRRETGHVLPKAIPGRLPRKERCCRPTESAVRSPSRCDARRARSAVPSRTGHRGEYGQHQSRQSFLGWTRKKRRSWPGNKMKSSAAWREQARQLASQDWCLWMRRVPILP